MNTTPGEGVALAKNILDLVGEPGKVKVVICPPATHLGAVSEVVKSSRIGLGAQNMHWESSGAFTGEISAAMLKQVGCEWVIIGHSERRTYFGETDRTVNQRLRKALDTGIRPIVCIGETLEEREAGRMFQVLERQLEIGLNGVVLQGSGGIVIAYEPVWAIGTGKTATAGQVQEAHRFIRDMLARRFGRESADMTVIQYGGSVKPDNAQELLACPDVDGALIGGVSLKADQFAAVVVIAEGLV